MKKIKMIFAILIFAGILIFSSKVHAAGTVSLSASKSSVYVGDEFTITVSLSGDSAATLTTRIAVDTSKVDYVSGPSNSNFSNGRVIYTWTDPNGGANPISGTIATFKFKAKATGKATFSVSGDFYNANYESLKPSFSGTSVTVAEEVVTPPPSTDTGGGGNTGGNTGSGDTNTGGGTTGGTTGGTGSNQPSTGGGTTGGGSTGGNTGGSTGGGTTNTPSTGGSTTTVSSNANLKALHLNIEGLSPAFSKNTTQYYITVPNNISSISVTAEPEESNAKVSVSGNTNLNIGNNKINIIVTAPDNKTKKTYVINVTKTDNPDNANASLLNLAVENVTLVPEFSPDIMQYNITVESEQESLNILAVPQIEGANVNIQGKDNLQFGDNTITITVTAKDGVTARTYTIIAHRKTAEEEQADVMLIEEIEEIVEQPVQEERKLNVGAIVYSVIILASTGGVIFILIRKYVNENR